MRENTVLHSFENHEKRRYADNYPQQHGLEQRFDAHAAYRGYGERCADKEECHHHSALCYPYHRAYKPRRESHIGVDHHGKHEDKYKPGDGYFCGFVAEYEHCGYGQRNYPQGAGELDKRGCLQCFLAIGFAGADNRGGVVDCDGGPCAELLLRHLEKVAERREDKEPERVKYEYYSERHRHFVFICLQHGAYGCYGAAAANGCARGYEVGCPAVDVQPVAYEDSKGHHADHGHHREKHAFGA